MFQLSIGNQNIGEPLEQLEAETWLHILARWFPEEVVWMKRVESNVAQYDCVPTYLFNEQPLLIILKRAMV